MRASLASIALIVLACACLSTGALAQDPPPGWLSYATASCPAGTRMTHYEGKWKVLNDPPPSGSFYSPWIGSDTTNNRNLIQPVNPWMGNAPWEFYTEWFTWPDYTNGIPENNVNSATKTTSPGHLMQGTMHYLGNQQYRIMQTDLQTRTESHQDIGVVQFKDGSYMNYTVLYVVFEKVAQECSDYPPEGEMTFEDLRVFCDGKLTPMKWTTSYVENVCDFRAHVINANTIKMTWNINGPPPTAQQRENNRKGGLKMPKFAKN